MQRSKVNAIMLSEIHSEMASYVVNQSDFSSDGSDLRVCVWIWVLTWYRTLICKCVCGHTFVNFPPYLQRKEQHHQHIKAYFLHMQPEYRLYMIKTIAGLVQYPVELHYLQSYPQKVTFWLLPVFIYLFIFYCTWKTHSAYLVHIYKCVCETSGNTVDNWTVIYILR